jgi:hypothetical protein
VICRPHRHPLEGEDDGGSKHKPLAQQVMVITGASSGIGLAAAQAAAREGARLDTNFGGVVNGSLAALPQLRITSGALINIGSEVSDAVIPLQGMYSASKHAVKGFTDTLRVEVEELAQHDEPPRDPEGTLWRAGHGGRVRGDGGTAAPPQR